MSPPRHWLNNAELIAPTAQGMQPLMIARTHRADKAQTRRVVGQAGGVRVLDGCGPVLGRDRLQALLVAQVPHLDHTVRAQADQLRPRAQVSAFWEAHRQGYTMPTPDSGMTVLCYPLSTIWAKAALYTATELSMQCCWHDATESPGCPVSACTWATLVLTCLCRSSGAGWVTPAPAPESQSGSSAL